jgi:hypothetical protein
MNDITIITPPDSLLNDAFGILLIFPSDTLKAQLQEVLKSSNMPLNVFLYEETDAEANIEWLLQSLKSADVCIIDVDNCNISTRSFTSHIIAQPCTFYLTNNGSTPYNIISKNRVFDVSWLENILRGNNE